jgi:metal-responsive CopG/Arc/MetJ family transcriptional regulator
MPGRTAGVQKITISLPVSLLEYADERAATLVTNRSAVIAAALSELQSREMEELAGEGYAFYSGEGSRVQTPSPQG